MTDEPMSPQERLLRDIFDAEPEEEEPEAEPTIRIGRVGVLADLSFPTVDNTGNGLHEAMGGYFETFPLPAPLATRNLIGLADEDGYSRNLPFNAASVLLGRQIVGPALIVKSAIPEFISLDDDDVRAVQEWFGQIEAIIIAHPENPRP